MSFLSVIILAILLILGVPVALSLLIATIPYFLFVNTTVPPDVVIQRMVASTESISMLAIPFFITAGAIMNRSGITDKLMNLADLLIGHVRGGLGQVNVLLSTIMGGMSGSAAADASTDCKILVPEMIKRGYDKPFCAAVTAASSLITPIIPPGIGLVLYAFLVNVSVGKMFAGGYIPGILMTVLMMLLVDYLAKKRGYAPSREKPATPKEIWSALRESLWALGLPVLLLVGLRFGVFSATEGGAMCALYAFIVGKFVYKELKIRDLPAIFKEAVLGTCTVMLVMCAASTFSFYLSWERIPHSFSTILAGITDNKYVFLLLVNIVFLFLGMFIEASSAVIILVPLLIPTVQALGIDLIHFGIIIVMNMTIGAITPPFGTVIFLVAPLLELRIADFAKELVPFILVLILALLLVTYIPQISLFLPNLLMK
jgi:tripartite ATP-independent transporter DctM subunit